MTALIIETGFGKFEMVTRGHQLELLHSFINGHDIRDINVGD